MSVRVLASLKSHTFIKILLPVLCLYGCATTADTPSNTNPDAAARTAAKPVNTNGMPKWMQDALAREIDSPLKSLPYPIDDLGVNLLLPGKPIGEIQDTTTSKFFRIDIGTDEAIGCEVYYSDFDPAYSITQLAEINFEETAEQLGNISNEILFSTDTGAYDNRPYHSLEWLASFGEGSDKKLALFKYRLAVIGDFGLACQHPEFGYRNTFEKAFKQLVDNFDYEKPDNPAYLVELASLSINDKVIGFYLEKYVEDADGDTVVSSMSSMLVPNTNRSVTPTDSYVITYSTPQGEIINSFRSSAENGDMGYDLELDFDQSQDAWVVSGEFRGKPFEQTLQHDSYIDSSLGQRIVLRQIAESDEANSGEIFYWDPDINPAEILSSTLNLSKKSGEERTAVYNIGPAEVTGTVDSNGSMKQARIEAGSQVLVLNRLWLGRE